MKSWVPSFDAEGQSLLVVDVHQHLWPSAVTEELRRRTCPPHLDGWTLHLDGEAPFEVEPGDDDLERRAQIDAATGTGRVLLSLSTALGVETLRPEEADRLINAWHALADELPDDVCGVRYDIWAAAGLVDPDLVGLEKALTHPRIPGLQVPATAMAEPAALERLAPVLAVAEAADVPVLVHPGPAAPASGAVPGWWPALTSYTSQLVAAWHAWHVAGRSLLPRLRIVFVGLAGLAPLHHERLAQRGGGLGPVDRSVYYETSSYGTRAIDALTRVVGVDPLVHGSDRPYAEPTDPGLGAAFARALFTTNPIRLLTGGDR